MTHAIKQPPSYTPQEIADMVGGNVSEKTVRQWIKAGELDAWDSSTIPNSLKPKYKITPEAFRAFQERRRVQVQKSSRRATAKSSRRKAVKDYYPKSGKS